MTTLKYILNKLLLTSLIIIVCKVSAQNPPNIFQDEHFILGEEHEGTESFEYKASDYINLIGGFNYLEPAVNQYFSAKIDPYLTVIPDEGTYGGPPNNNEDGVVGSLPGNLIVSNSGAAIYNIPIQLPPGRAGMTPELSLSYNSNGGNGLLGIGWSLGGLSAITRIGTNLYNDGFIDGVDFDALDEFALNGNRLIDIATNEYRTEIESFSKIIRHDSPQGYGPEWFEVWTKDGKRIEFGNTADSRIEGQNVPQVLYWLINRVEDRKGNYIDYCYWEDNVTAEFYITQIKYTGNINIQESPFYNIHFNYNYDRPEELTRYIAGCRLKTVARLESIEIKYQDNTLINRYELEYLDLFNSYLSKVTVFDKDDVKFNPTLFEYIESGTNGFIGYPSCSGYGSALGFDNENERPRFLTDVNGDGMADIVGFGHQDVAVSISTGNGWASYPGHTYFCNDDGFTNEDFPRMMADVNGDGMADIVAFGHDGVAIAISTGNGWTSYPGHDYFGSDDGFTPQNIHPRKMADVNGDGMADIVGFGHEEVAIAISTGNGWSTYPSPDGYGSDDGFDNENERPRILADVNGDGMADIVGFGHQDVAVSVSTGNGWASYPGHTYFCNDDGFTNADFPRMMADVNGDGMADIVAFGHDGVAIAISTGNGWTSYPGHDYFGSDDGFTPQNIHPRKMADVNGDGMADILGFGHEDVAIAVSTGHGWTSHPGYPYFGSDQGFDDENERPRVMADVNGDGISDIVGFGHQDVGVVVSDINLKTKLNHITNGFGITTSIQYNTLSRLTSPYYIKGNSTSSIYPLLNYQGPIYVVTQLTSGSGYPNETNYFYEAAKIHLQGKGFLGFSKMTTKTPYKNIEKITQQEFNIHETYYYPYLVQGFTGINDLEEPLNHSVYQNEVIEYPDKRIFPFIWKTCSKIKDLNATYIKTVKTINEYDNYGNITLSKVLTDPDELEITSDDLSFDFRSTTINSYNPPVIDSDWIIGQINQTTSTSTHPDDPTNPNTIVKSYDYYDLGDPRFPFLKSESTIPNNDNSLMVEVEFDYDPVYGNLKKKTLRAPDAIPAINPRVTDYFSEDTHHRFLTKTQNTVNGILHETSANYAAITGHLNSEVDVNGLVTSYVYDGFGKLTTTTFPDNNTFNSVLRWCTGLPDEPAGSVFYSWAKATGKAKSALYYDAMGNQLRAVTEGFAENTKIYQDNSYSQYYELSGTSEPFFSNEGSSALWTSYEYDYLGRNVTLITPASTFTYTFDGNTFTSLNTNTLEQTTKIVNAAGQPVTFEDDGGTVDYTYHRSGNVKEITSNGITVSMDYDNAGRQNELNDPDAGISTYLYNPFGDLVSQTDNIGNNYTMIYDDFGRLLQKTLVGSSDITTYIYDTEINGIGMLASITGSSISEFKYDQYSRMVEETETFEGNSYTSTYGYNDFGDLSKMTYPSGFELRYIYNSRGYLKYIKAPAIDTKVWLAEEINAKGQVEKFLLGNGRHTTHSYDSYGFPDKIITDNNVQELDFDFDPYTGNLTNRHDVIKQLEESFTYDVSQLNNRLTGYQVGTNQYSVSFLPNGNIDTKSDVGSYDYGGSTSRPHAVSSLTYDQPGNPEYTNDQAITYNAFNSTETIDEGNYHLDFTYGNDQQRIKTVLTENYIQVKSKLFIGGNYEIETDLNNMTRKLHYIGGFAIYVIENDGTGKMYYIHKDYLGSYYAITDEDGSIVQVNGVDQVYSFDPWGRRRNPDNWTYNLVPTEYLFDRGFTGHEHLDIFGLINMNGRMYDPTLGRMLSPDNFAQAPFYSQGLNRYSYALNNPLIYTDPSGEYFLIDDIVSVALGGLINLGVNIFNGNLSGMNFWSTIGHGAAAFGAGAVGGLGAIYPEFGGWIWGGAAVGATNAWLGGATSTGDILMGAGIGAVSGVIGGAAGSLASNAITPLISSSCGPVLTGAISGVVGGAVGGYTGGFSSGLLLTGDLSEANQAGIGGMWVGAGIGAASGAAYGFKYARMRDINPWTGKQVHPISPMSIKPINQIRTEPNNLKEQIALKAAKSGQGNQIMQGRIKDPNFQGNWVKMSYTHKMPDGMGYIEIHYWKNTVTGEMKGFKFKN